MIEPLRILLIHPHDVWYDPWCVRIIEIARSLKKMGHDPRVLYFNSGHRAKCRQSLPSDIEFIPLSRAKSAYYRNIRRVCALARTSDVVHVQKCWPNACIPAVWGAFVADKPLHYDWDDYEVGLVEEWQGEGVQVEIIRKWESAMLNLADSISCASQALTEKAVAARWQREAIARSPVGANLEMFSPEKRSPEVRAALGIAPEAPVVIYSGQLRAAAYADVFVMAARRVLSIHPETKFLILGSGDQLDHLQRLTQRENVADSIHFTGHVPHEKVPSYLASADVGVAAFEDTEVVRAKSPLKIAEYLASGLPIVGSDVGDVGSMIGDAGKIIPPGGADGIADAIIDILNKPELRKELALNARKRAEEVYNWDRTAERLLRKYP